MNEFIFKEYPPRAIISEKLFHEVKMKKMEGMINGLIYTLRYAGISHKGRVRMVNEDDFLIMPEFQLFCVADGMGGYEHGDAASKLTIDSLGTYFENSAQSPSDEGSGCCLEKAIIFANEQVFKAAGGRKMGSTVVAAQFIDNCLEIGHIGDSRAYCLRNKELRQLTEDHSLVYSLFKMGQISREQMRTHPHRNVVTKALGTEAQVAPDTLKSDILAGDLFLLCSDGLSGMIDDTEIAEILSTENTPGKAADKLILAANNAGGRDNITAVLVSVGSSPQ